MSDATENYGDFTPEEEARISALDSFQYGRITFTAEEGKRTRKLIKKTIGDLIQEITSLMPLNEHTCETALPKILRLGHMYLIFRDYVRAYDAYRMVIKKDSKSWDRDETLRYGMVIVCIYFNVDQCRGMETVLGELVKKYSQSPYSYSLQYHLALAFKGQGELSRALQVLEEVTASPSAPEMMKTDCTLEKAFIKEQQGDADSAVLFYQQVIDGESDGVNYKAMAAYHIARLHYYGSQFGDFEIRVKKALIFLEKSLELADFEYPHAWHLLGRCYMAVGKWQQAWESYQRALLISDVKVSILCALGLLMWDMGNENSTFEFLLDAIRSDPESHMGWSQLGFKYAAAGLMFDAAASFKRAARLTDLPQFKTLAQKTLEVLIVEHKKAVNEGRQERLSTTIIPRYEQVNAMVAAEQAKRTNPAENQPTFIVQPETKEVTNDPIEDPAEMRLNVARQISRHFDTIHWLRQQPIKVQAKWINSRAKECGEGCPWRRPSQPQ